MTIANTECIETDSTHLKNQPNSDNSQWKNPLKQLEIKICHRSGKFICTNNNNISKYLVQITKIKPFQMNT